MRLIVRTREVVLRNIFTENTRAVLDLPETPVRTVSRSLRIDAGRNFSRDRHRFAEASGDENRAIITDNRYHV